MSLFRTVPSTGDFSPLFRLLDDYDVHRSSPAESTTVRSFTPRFDVRETEDAYYLDGELPGTPQESIEIEFFDHHTLVVKGRAEREFHKGNDNTEPAEPQGASSSDVARTVTKSDNKQHRYWVSERSIGEFHRDFSFPGRVDQDKVRASLKNGILSVVVPKVTVTGSKKITIE